MIIEKNQKNNYLNNWRNEMIEFLKAFSGGEDLKIKIDKLCNTQEVKIDNAFKNGIDIGGVIKHIVRPVDIVYICDSENIASDFYWLVKNGKKDTIYPIKF